MPGLVTIAMGSYLAGAIPFSYLAGRIFSGIDLREHGSGNLGATNVFRFLGPKVAVLVLTGDIAKGFLPVFLAGRYALSQGMADHWVMLLAGFFAVVGHMFSVFVGFRGGKGIATTAGAFLALSPAALLGSFVVWGLVLATARIMSLASISGALILPLMIFLTGRAGVSNDHWSLFALSLLVTLFVLIKHTSNIKRLIAGREPVLRRHKPENDAG